MRLGKRRRAAADGVSDPRDGESVTISLGQATTEPLVVRVVNAVGQQVQHQPMAVGSSQCRVPTRGLQAGLYWVQVLGATSQRTGTLVIP